MKAPWESHPIQYCVTCRLQKLSVFNIVSAVTERKRGSLNNTTLEFVALKQIFAFRPFGSGELYELNTGKHSH